MRMRWLAVAVLVLACGVAAAAPRFALAPPRFKLAAPEAACTTSDTLFADGFE